MVHTCAVTQARSQLHDMYQVRIVSLESRYLLRFFSRMKADAALKDYLTVRLVLYGMRTWFTLQLSRFRSVRLSLGAAHRVPRASADSA